MKYIAKLSKALAIASSDALAPRMWVGLTMALVGIVGLMLLKGVDSAMGTVPYKYVAFYPMSGVSRIPLHTILKGGFPFVAAMVCCIILLVIFPQLALFIPYHLM